MNSLLSLLQEYKIIIPPIQRDYAQGRETGKIPNIRDRFIDNIFEVLSNAELPKLELDFVYGYIEKDTLGENPINVFKPLDGQQRLTTLFLIHWFVSNKEGKIDYAKPLLKKFSYAIRQSSRNFCDKLLDFKLNFEVQESIDKQIVNQPWFFSAWKNDPTIQSMLVVLKIIGNKFKNVNDIWSKLSGDNPRVVFHLLSMHDLGLPDDLYIKMNARGKPLTDFEQFKSSFSEIISEDKSKYFSNKIDGQWADLFWNIFKERENGDISKLVDDGFLSFFSYITEILIIQKQIIVLDSFWLNKIKTVYNDDNNVQFLFDCLDLFEDIERQEQSPFEQIYYVEDCNFQITKTKLFSVNSNPNLFRKCVETYNSGQFGIKDQLLLYAFIKIHIDKCEVEEDFYRLTRNLVENASDRQIRNDNLKVLYNAIDLLILGERKPENLPFTQRQLAEEATKASLLKKNPNLKDVIYRLEDHNLLRGAISVFSLDENIEYLGKIFLNLFKTGSNFFEISRAMLTFGFYPQNYGGGFFRFANKNSSNWREILTQSENRSGFENIKSVLFKYLDFGATNPDITNFDIARNYITNFETRKDIRYYYIKYNSFIFWNNNQTDGFYRWSSFFDEHYNCTMLFRTNFRGRSWNPFLLEINEQVNECTLIDDYNSKLQYTRGKLILIIEHFNEGFKFSNLEDDSFSNNYLNYLIGIEKLDSNGLMLIDQDDEKIDKIDRIENIVKFINELPATINN